MDDPQEGRALGCISAALAGDPKPCTGRNPVRPPLDPDHPPLVGLVPERIGQRLDRVRLGDTVTETVQFGMDLDQRERAASRQYCQTGGTQPPPPQHGCPSGKRRQGLTTVRRGASAPPGKIDPEPPVHTPTLLAQRTPAETQTAQLPVELPDVLLELGVVPLEAAALLARHGTELANRINTALVHGRIAF